MEGLNYLELQGLSEDVKRNLDMIQFELAENGKSLSREEADKLKFIVSFLKDAKRETHSIFCNLRQR